MEAGPFSLGGRNILVTGASSGIGRATALMCARLGASVVLTGRNETALQSALAQANESAAAGTHHRAIVAEQTDQAARNALVDAIDGVDGVVFCAGHAELAPLRMLSERHLNTVMAVNFEAPMMLTQRLLARRKVREGAALVYVTAVADRFAPVATGIYSAAKSALTVASKTLALELASRRIRVNCVSPGYVSTPMLEQLNASAGMGDKLDLAPLGAIEPDDVAHGIVFMLMPATRWATRTTLTIDAGLTVYTR